MSTIRSLFEATLAPSEKWLDDLQAETGWDEPERAYSTLRAVLHALRDRLTPGEAADLAAHLPVLLRGVYYEGWRPASRPQRYRHREAFLAHVQERYARNQGDELEAAVAAVFQVLARHLPAGEIEDIKHQLPADVRSLWPEAARFS